MDVIVAHADAAGTPMEIRLLNKAQPVIVGEKADSGANLDAVRTLLSTEPSGLTPVCKQIREVIERIKSMEAELVASNKIAILLIITDGESTDGNVADMLKPLEGNLLLPYSYRTLSCNLIDWSESPWRTLTL